MIKIENVVLPSTQQWLAVIRGMRNPKNSWHLIDSGDGCIEQNRFGNIYKGPFLCKDCPHTADPGRCICFGDKQFIVGQNDHKLMMSLARGGAVHAKYRRMLPVYADITANHTWWAEFDTYKVGTVRNSCSKMHKIHVKAFVPDDFSHEGIDEVGGAVAEHFSLTLNTLEWLRVKFNETHEKKYWRAMVELLPMGFNLRATVFLNYEVLHNIYNSRGGHKMLEWHTVCDWIETLPYSEIITMKEAAQ